MSDPTFQLTLIGGAVSLQSRTFNRPPLAIQLGYPVVHRLGSLTTTIDPAERPFQFGYPRVLRLLPMYLNKDFIFYDFAFFYPSNGKIPGSPIPRTGQLLPRPL